MKRPTDNIERAARDGATVGNLLATLPLERQAAIMRILEFGRQFTNRHLRGYDARTIDRARQAYFEAGLAAFDQARPREKAA
jgi:hypothetical protein